MLFARTTHPRDARRPHAGRRTAGVLTALAVAATMAAAPSPASASDSDSDSAKSSANPAYIGLFGSTDATYDGVYRQSLSLIALDAADAKVPNASVEWLKRQRCNNGSFTSFRPDLTEACGVKDSNATALAVLAFKRLGHSKLARTSVNWLIDQQKRTGGWEYSAGWGPDSNSTGLVVQALIAMKIDPAAVTKNGNSPIDFLTRLQLDCDSSEVADRGALDYQLQSPLVANDFATAQATAALAGSSLPVKPGDASTERPRFTCDAQPQPTAAAAAAGYLGRTIRANDGHIPYFDNSIDYGSTANAVLSLVAAGYAANQINRAVSTLESGAVEYTHDDNDKVLSASSAALALVAIATGGDPRSVGGVNPVRQLLDSRITAR